LGNSRWGFRIILFVKFPPWALGRFNFLDLLLRHNALVGGHPGPRKKADELFLLVDTTIEGESPSHARQE
jgi:hypothetical protein